MPPNVLALRVFGPILIATGVLGFVLPPNLALMSGAAPYNVFHLVFGVAGTVLGFTAGDRACRAWNGAFGALDLYQAVASPLVWWPAAHFQWRTADDVVHWTIGFGLVALAVLARGPVRAGPADRPAPR